MPAAVELVARERRWACPSCTQTAVTFAALEQPGHVCPGVKGLSVPFVEVFGDELPKHAVRHVLVEREDYIAGERVQYDRDGRPLMALRTERPDGSNDVIVYAPTAVARGLGEMIGEQHGA